VKPAAGPKPTPKPGRGGAATGEKASRNAYQTVDGRSVQGTKEQIEAWERMKAKGQTSGPERKPKAA
jgi:hypothetical protein